MVLLYKDVYTLLSSSRTGNHFKQWLAISNHMLLSPFPQPSRMPVGFMLGSLSAIPTSHFQAQDFFASPDKAASSLREQDGEEEWERHREHIRDTSRAHREHISS